MNQKYKYTIRKRLLLRIILPIAIILFVIQIFNYNSIKYSLQDANRRKSNLILDEIKTFQEFQDIALNILEGQLNEEMKETSSILINKYFVDTVDIHKRDLHSIRSDLKMDPSAEDIYVINREGIVVNTTFKDDLFLDFFSFGKEHEKFLLRILTNKQFVSDNFTIESKTKRLKKYSYQATLGNNYIIELGVYSQQADKIIDFVSNQLHNLTRVDNSIISANLFVGADRPYSLFSKAILSPEESQTLSEVFNRQDKFYSLQDPHNKNVVTEYMYVPRANSQLYKGAVVQIKFDRSIENSIIREELLKSIAVSMVLSILIIWFISDRIHFDIINPVRKIRKVLAKLAEGNFDEMKNLKIPIKNEFGEIADYINDLTFVFTKATKFAVETGKGDLSIKYKLSGKQDKLGRALMRMQEELKHLEKVKGERDAEDSKQKWATDGLNKFAEILRETSISQKELAQNIISNLVTYVDANQGGLFLYNDSNPEDVYLELIATYAYNQEREIERKVYPGEGLVGMCVMEKYTIHRTEIPENYINITSGLGDATPTALLIVPLKLHEEIFGVIELASFKDFTDFEIDFIEKVAESISYTLSTVRINTQTNLLLKQSQKQSEEFARKEEGLLRQIDELKQKLEDCHEVEQHLINELEITNKDLELANEKIKKFRHIQMTKLNPKLQITTENNED